MARQVIKLTATELLHLGNGPTTQKYLIDRIEPTVRRLQRSGLRSPRDVSEGLNESGERTLRGDKWTPHLAWIVMKWIGLPEAEDTAPKKKPPPKKRPPRPPRTKPPRPPKPEGAHPPKPAPSSASPPPPAQPPEPESKPAKSSAMVAKLPDMRVDEIMQLFQNAVRMLADEGRRPSHSAAREVLSAIGGEWARRKRQPPDPDGMFDWPSTRADGGDGQLRTDGWLPQGLLGFVEYRVGRTQGVSAPVRRALLHEIFTGELPAVFPAEYLDEWGDPSTAGRLQEMAETIAALTRNAKRRRMAPRDAIRDWESDLRFLYERYYVNYFHFAWPSSEA